MDLSNYGKTHDFREKLIEMSPAMIGSVPMYDAIGYLEKDLLEITAKDFLRVVEAHAREGVYFVTQSAYDVSKESLKNNIGLKFAFRSTDINEIKQTLEFFGIDKDDENNQKRLRDLENGQCLLQDLYGRVGVVQIHPVFEELLHAFDTRPPVKRNEVE